MEPQRSCHVLIRFLYLSPFRNHTFVSNVILSCSAEVIHQQRAFVRPHGCWYFNLWAPVWNRAFVYSPHFRSSHQKQPSVIMRSPSTFTHTCVVRTHTLFWSLFYFCLDFIWSTIWNHIDLLQLDTGKNSTERSGLELRGNKKSECGEKYINCINGVHL